MTEGKINVSDRGDVLSRAVKAIVRFLCFSLKSSSYSLVSPSITPMNSSSPDEQIPSIYETLIRLETIPLRVFRILATEPSPSTYPARLCLFITSYLRHVTS
ncbi:hypothetical protein L1887_35499 [Cichorium endivia]|nr:hypothetical protein L1887_35499 [Cichorium endivia]